MADTIEEKSALRAQATEARRIAHAGDIGSRASQAVTSHLLAHVPLPAGAAIGGYWPIGTELDVKPVLAALHQRGHVCGLPTVRKRQPLVFHRWRPNDELVPGAFGILVPDRSTPEIVPDVLLVPMLAFDARGQRLGYGGGYYDRTIPAIRARKTLLTVGIAYAAQEVDNVPTDEFDQRLDWIVTEKGATRIERRRFPWLRRFFMS